jgi:hypothetical protein
MSTTVSLTVVGGAEGEAGQAGGDHRELVGAFPLQALGRGDQQAVG